MKPNELLAVQLHCEYRAAEKAMNRNSTYAAPTKNRHDHGWLKCHRQDYFCQRAAMLLKRSTVTAPETLGEAECALAATVMKEMMQAKVSEDDGGAVPSATSVLGGGE